MAGVAEDFRVAVGFSVTLSGQLVQAAVTLLTVQGAYMAYALASRETKSGFELAAGLAVIVFILSIYASGRGVTAARNAGFDGSWNLGAGKSAFNAQAILLIVGVALLAIMVFRSGTSKDSDAARQLIELTQSNRVLEAKIRALSEQMDAMAKSDAQRLLTFESELKAVRESMDARAPGATKRKTTTPKRTKGSP